MMSPIAITAAAITNRLTAVSRCRRHHLLPLSNPQMPTAASSAAITKANPITLPPTSESVHHPDPGS